MGKMGHGFGVVFFCFFGVHANCPNFVPLKMKIREKIKVKKKKQRRM